MHPESAVSLDSKSLGVAPRNLDYFPFKFYKVNIHKYSQGNACWVCYTLVRDVSLKSQHFKIFLFNGKPVGQVTVNLAVFLTYATGIAWL